MYKKWLTVTPFLNQHPYPLIGIICSGLCRTAVGSMHHLGICRTFWWFLQRPWSLLPDLFSIAASESSMKVISAFLASYNAWNDVHGRAAGKHCLVITVDLFMVCFWLILTIQAFARSIDATTWTLECSSFFQHVSLFMSRRISTLDCY